jgi:hypothetical protein
LKGVIIYGKTNSKNYHWNGGGTASKNASTYKISLPTTWANELKITPENREVLMSFEGENIIISRS